MKDYKNHIELSAMTAFGAFDPLKERMAMLPDWFEEQDKDTEGNDTSSNSQKT